ncbi:MAG: alpha/beta hydrolase [Caldilineaceae bacterium]
MMFISLLAGACQPVQPVSQRSQRGGTPAVSTGIAEVNGTKLYYEMKGAGEPVVLIHGFSLDNRMWDDQFEHLSANYKVIRYDGRGHGQSAPITGPFKPEEDLRALLDFLKIDQVHIVGHSLGGAVAAYFALTYPQRVKSLVFVDLLVPDAPAPSELLPRLGGYMDAAHSAGLETGLKQWLADPLFASANAIPAIHDRLTDIVLKGQTALGQGAAFINLQNIALDAPVYKRLAEISAPTLVILGEKDIQEFHAMVDNLSQGIKKAQRVVIKGAGHIAPMEKPTEVTDTILKFLAAASAPA